MNRSSLVHVVYGCLICLVSADACCVAQGYAPVPDDRPYAVQTAANTDRNLFPIYVLDHLYSSLPSVTASAQEQSNWIASTRSEAQRMRAIIRDQQLDSSLDVLYRDCLEFTSAYETFLSRSIRITQQTEQTAFVDLIMSVMKAAEKGSDAEDLAKRAGTSKESASNIGAVAGIVSGTADFYSRNQRLTATEADAMAAEKRKLLDSWATARSDGQVISVRLARKYGWSQGEADVFSDSASTDYASMPRNPFAVIEALIRLKGDETPSVLTGRANRCFHAAEMVPADEVYDRYRNLFLYESASLAVSAASAEAGNRGYSAGPTPSSGNAVHFVHTYLSASPTDPGGAGNLLLARALGESGRYTEAVAADNRAFQIAPNDRDDMVTALRYGKLLSLAGAVNESAQWLAKAYSLGYSDVAYERQDPDFANLRRSRPDLFAQLTTVKLTNPWFDWGVFNDDALLRNDSLFPLTNLSVRVVVHKGAAVYSFTMRCPEVKSGEACRGSNVVSIPGDSYDSLQWTYSSDQGRS